MERGEVRVEAKERRVRREGHKRQSGKREREVVRRER